MKRPTSFSLVVVFSAPVVGHVASVRAAFPLTNHTASGSATVQINGGGAPVSGAADLAHQTGKDCNANGIPDEDDLAAGTSLDCNSNLSPDECDLSAALSPDANGNNVPDECDVAVLSGDDLCWSGFSNDGTFCSSHADCSGGGICGTKNRYLSMTFDDGGVGPLMTALQVKVLDVPANLSSQQALMEGDIWWAGPPSTFPEGPGSMVTFKAATLQCTTTPHLRDWAVEAYVHLYGAAVIPGTRYEIRMCSSSLVCGRPLVIFTGKNGDVIRPFVTLQPDYSDLSAMADKFQAKPSFAFKTRAQMQPNAFTPEMHVNFLDISAVVAAYQGYIYAFPGASCP